MSEKTAVLERRAVFTGRAGSPDIGKAAVWALCGLLMELGSGGGAPGSSALAAGLRGGSVWVYAGGAAGRSCADSPGDSRGWADW